MSCPEFIARSMALRTAAHLARYAKTKQTYETGLIGTADHSRERVRHHAD